MIGPDESELFMQLISVVSISVTIQYTELSFHHLPRNYRYVNV